MTSPASPLTSALQEFTADGKGGILASLAPMLPMLLGQAAGLLREMPAEEVDAYLLFAAQACLGARSVDAEPTVVIATIEGEPQDVAAFAAALSAERAPHNED